MKREKIIEKPFFVLALICCVILINMFRDSPLEKVDFTDCTIGVYAGNGQILEYLTDEQVNEFITVLEKAEIGGSVGKAYENMLGGTWKKYKVFLKNGEELDIAPYDVMLIIGQCGYKCDMDTLNQLEAQWEEILSNQK